MTPNLGPDPNLIPAALRVAFRGVTEAILPPGSMTPEGAEKVANRFADAWDANLAELAAAKLRLVAKSEEKP